MIDPNIADIRKVLTNKDTSTFVHIKFVAKYTTKSNFKDNRKSVFDFVTASNKDFLLMA